MLSDAELLAQYCWLYVDTPVPPGTWDHVIDLPYCNAAIKRVDGTDYVMFRGSTTFLDWIQDFQNAALPFPDQRLGPVHNGFRDGVLSCIGWLNSLVGGSVVVVGHSLGSGHSALYAGYRIRDGLPVNRLVMFGAPRAGGPRLRAILDQIEGVSYRNQTDTGHDLVTGVPFNVPFILNYVDPKPFTLVSAEPTADDPWSIFKYHHCWLYTRAIGASGPAVDLITPKPPQ